MRPRGWIRQWFSTQLKNKFSGPQLTPAWSFGIFAATLTISFAFLGFVQMFPWWANASIYTAGLLVIMGCGYWCDLKWTGVKRTGATLGVLVYVAVFGHGSIVQYQHEYDIHLVFKDSPLLGWWRKQVITHDIANLRERFIELDIPVPTEIPPIGIIRGNDNCMSWSNMAGNPVFRSNFLFGEKCLSRKMVTSMYSNRVMEVLPSSRPLPDIDKRTPESVQRANLERIIRFWFVMRSFAAYLNWSLWGEKANSGCQAEDWDALGAYTLWDIRENLGADFTDRMVAYAARSAADNPLEGDDPDMMVYFCRRIKIGEFVVDDGVKWPIILEILKKNGVPIEKI